MKRGLSTSLAFMPLQSIWAAAAGYCSHEETPGAAHFGHHVHRHHEDGDGATRVCNRLLWATPDGQLAHYDKRHLFRFAGEHKRYSAGCERLCV